VRPPAKRLKTPSEEIPANPTSVDEGSVLDGNDPIDVVKQLENRVKLLARDKLNLAKKVSKLEMENSKLEGQLEVLILPNPKAVAEDIAIKNNQINELENDLGVLKESLESREIEFKNVKSDIEAMEKENEELLERLSQDERRILNLKDTLCEMEQEMDVLDEENYYLKDQLKSMKGTKVEEMSGITSPCQLPTHEDMALILKKRDDLESQLTGMEKERDDLDVENTALQLELKNKDKELEVLKAKLSKIGT